MAWIQIHQQLKDHRKVLAAADELDIEPAHMLGLLISFWLWAIDNAPDGSLAGISDRMIARAAQWDKDPEEFVAALTSASLLDVTEDGVLEIHDWSEYTGKLIEQRENEKNRSRARRAAAKSNDRRTTAGQETKHLQGRRLRCLYWRDSQQQMPELRNLLMQHLKRNIRKSNWSGNALTGEMISSQRCSSICSPDFQTL